MVVWQGVFLATSSVPESGMPPHKDPPLRTPKPSQWHLPEVGAMGQFSMVLEVINMQWLCRVQRTSSAGAALE